MGYVAISFSEIHFSMSIHIDREFIGIEFQFSKFFMGRIDELCEGIEIIKKSMGFYWW